MPESRPIARYVTAGGIVLILVGFAVLALVIAGMGDGAQALSVTTDARAGSHLAWLVDPGQRLALDDVRNRPAGDWKTWNGKNLVEAAHGEALWLRITLRNPGPAPLRGVLEEAQLYPDRVEAWMERPDGSWQRELSGESLSAGARPWWALTAAFAVEVPAGGERVVYVRETDYHFPSSWFRWWPRSEDYMSAQFREVLVKAFGLGILAALWFYNLILWARLRFPDMGYYVAYAAATSLFNFVECGGLAAFGGGVGEAWRMTLEAGLLAVSVWCAITFARLFLATAERMPRVDRGLRWLRAGWVIVLAGVLTMPWFAPRFWLATVIFGVAVTHSLLLAVAVAAWWRGFRAARFFVLAFGVLCLGGVPSATAWGGGGQMHVVVIVLLFASGLEMLLLSFAVADRFAQAQRQLAEETEQRRAIEEAYADELEMEVRERTRELEEANTDKDRMLAVIGHDLRSPLTGLMKSADQPSPNFARDTAHTGRALLLMIEDLVLWARMRAGTRDVAAHPARALLQPAVALHRALAEHGGTELVLDVPDRLRVETDLVLAQTLVRNLLANALKFARTRVVLRAQRVADRGVRFSVSNDGPSLPAEIIARLNAGQNEPMTAIGGLGLRLCREICAALGMRLAARVPAEGGAEFAFILPAAENLPEETP